jgi:hypothetical protein
MAKTKKDKRTDNTMDKTKKDKRTNNDLQNIAQKANDWATRTPLKTGDELRTSKQFLLY